LYARQLDRDLNKARAEIDRLKSEMRKLMDEAAAGRQAASRLAECEKELNALRQQVQQLQSQLAAEQRSGGDAKQRLAQLEQELAACQQQLATLTEQLRAAQAQNARLREDHDKVCGELRRQLSSLGQLTQQGGNMVLTLASDILFDFNSAELKPVARENLAKLAALRMLLFPQADVRYEGHTDRVGEDDYNQWLSEQRALSVYRYFLEERIARESDSAAREAARDRLTVVQQLLAMQYAAGRRGSQRADLMAKLGGTVSGKGERDPVEDVQTQSERNRRVVLLFPPAQTGQATSLCEQK
jgi:outer membrane protein OmpA-like peptidoglycan-associated protein